MSAIRCSNNRRAAGFTLLEVLVVLLIVGLVAASLFEALSRLNDVRGRIGPYLGISEREGLMNSWFRTAVNDIVPDQQYGKHLFKGGASSFSGLSMAPLAGDPGAASPFLWELVYDGSHDRTILRYTGYDQKPIEVRSWHGSKAAFGYLGPDQSWNETWPPGLKKTKQLPLAIRLYAKEQGDVVVAAIRGEKEPPPDPLALFTGQNNAGQ
jgi:prepilin-type N-terminal cleavage/methylation domain-containing protein